MFAYVKAQWRTLKEGTAGHRFEEYHDARRARGRRPHPWLIAPAVALVVLGIVMLPAPGPGMLVILVGLGLLARESRAVARGLDRAERTIRPWIPRLHRR